MWALTAGAWCTAVGRGAADSADLHRRRQMRMLRGSTLQTLLQDIVLKRVLPLPRQRRGEHLQQGRSAYLVRVAVALESFESQHGPADTFVSLCVHPTRGID